jgi:hypothetical protein
MAIQVRSDFELPTLRIFTDPHRSRVTQAVFEVVRGDDTAREVTRCGLDELGLPDSLTGVRRLEDEQLTVPRRVIDDLQRAVSELGTSPLPPENALWLEFPSPRGYLYIAPWERLLADLDRTMFRLPYHLVRPQVPGPRLDVAICVSTPEAKTGFSVFEALEPLVRQYLSHTRDQVAVHIFTDEQWFHGLGAALSYLNTEGQVVVHDPQDAADYEPAPDMSGTIGQSAEVSNPWLRWMRDAVGGSPLDFVHFVTHGYLSGNRGAIALAPSPTYNADRGWSRFLGSSEVSTFLAQIGAWGLGLTGPPGNYSAPGLRELADAIALSRPGVVITHDITLDSDCQELGAALQTVLSAHAPPLRGPLPSTTCWVHPRFVEFPEQYSSDLYLNADGSSAFVGGATMEALGDSGTESWVASASRALETQQMKWLPDAAEAPTDPAAVEALRNVADLVERHVSRAYPRGTAGGHQ